MVWELIKGTTTASEVAGRHDLTVAEVEPWRENFITQGTEVRRSHPRDTEVQWQAREKDLLAKIGDLTMEKEVLKKTRPNIGQGLTGRDLVIAVYTDCLETGLEGPFSRVCRWLGVARSTAYYAPKTDQRDRPVDQEALALIEAEPGLGVRMTWARMRHGHGWTINKKKVHRIMRLEGLTLRQRRKGARPRVEQSRSGTDRANERWSTDIALVDRGVDGWCAFVPVLDCPTREVLGWELERTARAKIAERALENALLGRFGTLRGAPEGMKLRHDNGLVFGSRTYRALVADYGLKQEYIAPYTPQQNGLCERFIRTFKEACCWVQRFKNLEQARRAVGSWITFYNQRRPHSAINYQTPEQAMQRASQAVA